MLLGVQFQTSATSAALPIALLSYTCQIVPDQEGGAGASCLARPMGGNTTKMAEGPRISCTLL